MKCKSELPFLHQNPFLDDLSVFPRQNERKGSSDLRKKVVLTPERAKKGSPDSRKRSFPQAK